MPVVSTYTRRLQITIAYISYSQQTSPPPPFPSPKGCVVNVQTSTASNEGVPPALSFYGHTTMAMHDIEYTSPPDTFVVPDITATILRQVARGE